MKVPLADDLVTIETRAFRPSVAVANRELLASFLFLFAQYALSAIFPPFMYLFPLTNALITFRFFVISHDCIHSIFYPGSRANTVLGNLLTLVTLTPIAGFKQSHLTHHRLANQLHHSDYGFNHTVFFTTEEYARLSTAKRLAYRLLRAPVVFFALAPALNFLRGLFMMKGPQWALLACISTALLIHTFLGNAFLLAWLLSQYLFNFLVIFGVHIQHTFNPAYCRAASEWSFKDSALLGSSDHPTFGCKWFFMGVEHHSLHHLCPQIPVYWLDECFRQHLSGRVRSLTFAETMQSLSYTLYDEAAGKYVTFKESKAASRQ